MFFMRTTKIFVKIICRGSIASLYLGRIKKTETMAKLKISEKIKKFIL